MKKILLLIFAIIGILRTGQAQWTYDFGTGATNSFSTANQVQTAPTFIPSAQPIGVTTTARVGSQGGSITLSNPTGTNASLIIVASTGGSVNKLAFSGYTASTLATTKFKIGFGTAISGYFNFVQGKITASPTSYTSGSSVQNADTFSGLRFIYNADGSTINVAYRTTSGWTLFASPVNLAQGETYEIEVYMNNSNTTTNYVRGTAQTIAPGRSDLWITPINALTGTKGTPVKEADDYVGAGLPSNSNMDSFAFYAEASASNEAVTSLDDIVYANYIAPTTLPVNLTSFTGKANDQTIDLNWKTSSEQDNSHFEILRSSNGKDFAKIGKVNGNGTTQIGYSYNFNDANPIPGVNYYQLKQVDNNGNFKLYDAISVKSNVTASALNIFANTLKQTLEVNIKAATNGNASFKIYDINGQKVIDQSLLLEKGNNTISIPAYTGSTGVYVATLILGSEKITKKFVK